VWANGGSTSHLQKALTYSEEEPEGEQRGRQGPNQGAWRISTGPLHSNRGEYSNRRRKKVMLRVPKGKGGERLRIRSFQVMNLLVTGSSEWEESEKIIRTVDRLASLGKDPEKSYLLGGEKGQSPPGRSCSDYPRNSIGEENMTS